MKIFLLNILIITVSLGYSNAIYSCKSPSGQDVDWFVVYKLPALPHRNRLIEEGRAYLYADGTSYGWTLPDHGIENRESAIGRTVRQRFQFHEQQFFIVYNDKCPQRRHPNYDRGHLKGMVVSDDSRGFWLTHSVPNFPILDRGEHEYEYPQTELPKGQSFLCFNMSANEFNVHIAPLLHFSEANVCYGNQLHRLPQWIQQNVHVRAILQQDPFLPSNVEDSFQRVPLNSFNGYAFEAFFKCNGFDLDHRDLYSYVSNELEIVDFMVQSYIADANLPPMNECQNCFHYLHCPFKVRNITKICLNLQNIHLEFNTFFPEGPDHSKWAVSNGHDHWVCIGDLNRQQSQIRQGGGAVCFQNVIIANLFRQAVCGVQEWCSRH